MDVLSRVRRDIRFESGGNDWRADAQALIDTADRIYESLQELEQSLANGEELYEGHYEEIVYKCAKVLTKGIYSIINVDKFYALDAAIEHYGAEPILAILMSRAAKRMDDSLGDLDDHPF